MFRNTLSNRKGNGAEEKPVIKTKRAKDAPDFSKLHKKWETKLAKVNYYDLHSCKINCLYCLLISKSIDVEMFFRGKL